MSSISDTSTWIKFFTEAGIPAGDATSYAIIFTDNRIKQTMLLDLNKEYLRDMGITLMGDIIMILKHAKVVSGNLSRQRVMESSSSSTSQRSTSTPPPTAKKSTPASRTLEHYLRKEERPPPSPPTTSNSNNSSTLSPSLSARLGGGVKRSVEEEDSVVPNKRSSVFNRLGDNLVSSTTNDSPKITVTMHGKDVVRTASTGTEGNKKLYSSSSSSSSSVFGRLSDRSDGGGDSEEETQKSTRPLEYHGILKYSSKESNEKAAILKKQNLTSKLGGGSFDVATMKADTTTNVKSRLGAQGCVPKSVSASAGIFARERDEFHPTNKSAKPASSSDTSFRQFKRETKKLAIKKTLNKSSEDSVSFSPPSSPSPSRRTYVKKIIKVNKKTGEIVSEEKIPLKTNVFSRLGN